MTATQSQLLANEFGVASSVEQTHIADTYGSVSNVAFTGQLKAAVESRLGLPVGGGPKIMSVTNAPFFSSTTRNIQTTGATSDAELVLPPRRHADKLVDDFWHYLYPLEPFLDEPDFRKRYEDLFAGNLSGSEERIFISLLNVMFALVTQSYESIEPEQRIDTSATFFNRAWSLLHLPNFNIWDQASIELIDCLLLLTSYLKCTNNPYQTRMVAGTAVLAAQCLGLHRISLLSEYPVAKRKKCRQLWLACLYMDRYGRGATTSQQSWFAV